MMRRCAAALVVLWVVSHCLAAAQPSAGGSIRGTARDTQGAMLPGVSIVMTSSDPPDVREAVTDKDGTYRFVDVPAGSYTLRASLLGFTTREHSVILRAGLNVTLDLTMQVGGVAERVEVRHEAPLLESSTAVRAVNLSGALQRKLPLSERRRWSDVLTLTPGVTASAGFNGEQLFSLHGSERFSHVVQLDGMNMAWTALSSPTEISVNTDLVEDVQVKTSGMDASAPLGFGAVINVATRSGTNQLRGAGSFALQPMSWNDRNSAGTSAAMRQLLVDLSAGGPLRKDRAWWFAAYRHHDGAFSISRTPDELSALTALVPGFVPFDNEVTGAYYFVKPTMHVSPSQSINAQFQQDFRTEDVGSSLASLPFATVLGGPVAGVRLSSVWHRSFTTRLAVAWNRKRREYEQPLQHDQPLQYVYRQTVQSGTLPLGTGLLAYRGSPTGAWTESADERVSVTGDANFHSPRGLGSHDLQAGFSLEPRLRERTMFLYAAGGFALEEAVLATPDDLSSPVLPFHRQIWDSDRNTTVWRESSDYALYVQDVWRPVQRLAINVGLRVDWVRRDDRLCVDAGFPTDQCITQDSTEMGPRLGVNYLLTRDGRTRLYTSWGRIHEALALSAASVAVRSPGLQNHYDTDLDGTFDTVLSTPGRTAISPNRVIDSTWHQPYIDEASVGLSRQWPGSIEMTVAAVRRKYAHRAALVETNGIYDGAVFQGYRDEDLNELHRLVNNRWNWPVYTSIEVSVTRQSSTFQMLASYLRQWRRIDGTWQPSDPASFLRPAAFPNDRGIGSTRGSTTLSTDANSLSGSSMTDGTQWRDHVVRLGASWAAPQDILIALHYTFQSGLWSGPVVARVEDQNHEFGPPTVALSNGRLVDNPLATAIRFAHPTRGEGQLRTPAHHVLNVRIGHALAIGHARLEGSLDLLNVFNHDADLAFKVGGNQTYNPDFGQLTNRQAPRSIQVSARLTF